jgi:peptide-methionine (S)-S-oxide reductase
MLRYLVCVMALYFVSPLAFSQVLGERKTNTKISLTSEELDNWAKEKKLSSVVLGGGCFWCTEAAIAQLKGVEKVVSGYSGGHVENPTYEMVLRKNTGHVEVAQVFFDPKVVSLEKIMSVFFVIHDPTSMDRQGADAGPQYRSAIFYSSEEQKKVCQECMDLVGKALAPSKVVTVLEPLKKFYPAEDYHQEYFKNNPEAGYCRAVVFDKVMKVRKSFAELLKPDPTKPAAGN